MGLEQMEIKAADNGRLRYYLQNIDVKRLLELEGAMLRIGTLLDVEKNNVGLIGNALRRKFDSLYSKKCRVWDEIYHKYGISPEGKYEINTKTMEITVL